MKQALRLLLLSAVVTGGVFAQSVPVPTLAPGGTNPPPKSGGHIVPVQSYSPNLPFPQPGPEKKGCCAACSCEVEAVVLKYKMTFVSTTQVS